jgi:hypothetical protein
MARFGTTGVWTLATALLVAATHPGRSADFPCADVLRMHGLLRKAAGSCGFRAYNPSLVEQAHACFDAMGGRSGAEAMIAGAAEFEHLRSVRNHEAVCAMIASKFPMVVRP